MKKIHNIKSIILTKYEMDIYMTILKKKHLDTRHLGTLCQLNSLISKELYLITSLTEKLFKSSVHTKMKAVYHKEDWYNGIEWKKNQLEAINEIKRKHKQKVSPDEVIEELPLGFWVHLMEHSYRDVIYVPVISTIFPYFPRGLSPTAHLIKDIFINCLSVFRNDIAHCKIIIQNEKHLLKCYNSLLQVIYWMSPVHYKWLKQELLFDEYYEMLVSSSYDFSGYIHYRKSRLKYWLHKLYYPVKRYLFK